MAIDRTQRLKDYARPYLKWYGVGVLFLVLTNLAALAIPARIGEAVQIMREASEATFSVARSGVVDAAIAVIILAAVGALARIASRIAIFNAARYVEYDLRNDIYAHLSRLAPSFYGSMATGDLTSRAANDVGFVRALFAVPPLYATNALLAYFIALRQMIAIDPWLTAACLATYPLLLVAVRKIIIAMFEQTIVLQEELAAMSAKVQENLSGVSVVKAYVLEDRESQIFAGMNDVYVEKKMKLATLRGAMNAVIATIAGIGTLVVLAIGSQSVVAGTMQLGTFVEFNGYVVALAFPTIGMGWVFSVWHRGLAGFERICEILDREPDIDDPGTEPIEFDNEGAEIVLDHVDFAYGDTQVLHDVSMRIEPGETVAIVGRTGSGKTTLLQLLSRFADPTSGEVRVDGRALNRVPLRCTRAEFGVVPQGPFLFSMTLGNNLRFGLDAFDGADTDIVRPPPSTSLRDPARSASSEERVQEAIEMAGLSEDLQGFPDGLDTLVGERGITLSGGQKQRVTIARALLCDPRVLILDDALSSVDTKTEATILDHLETVMGGRTSIVVTHRFNALPRFDRVFVLERGRIVESGTHDELVDAGGVYATMYARQQLAEELQ